MQAGHATLIGGHGFIGRHLQARLRRDGWSVFVASRDEAELHGRDLGCVFYCAGMTGDYAASPSATVEAHVALLGRILRSGSYESLVYLSSTRLYDGLGDVEATEETPLRLLPHHPRHLFDLSKALGESLCLAAGGGRARVARLACVWSDAPDAPGFLPTLIREVLACRADGAGPAPPRLRVDSSPGLARDYVHIDAVLDALIALARHHGFGIYNVAGGRNVMNARLFERLGAAAGCEIVAARSDPPVPMPRVSIARMAAAFGWGPADSLELATGRVEGACACWS